MYISSYSNKLQQSPVQFKKIPITGGRCEGTDKPAGRSVRSVTRFLKVLFSSHVKHEFPSKRNIIPPLVSRM